MIRSLPKLWPALHKSILAIYFIYCLSIIRYARLQSDRLFSALSEETESACITEGFTEVTALSSGFTSSGCGDKAAQSVWLGLRYHRPASPVALLAALYTQIHVTGHFEILLHLITPSNPITCIKKNLKCLRIFEWLVFVGLYTLLTECYQRYFIKSNDHCFLVKV